MSPSSPPRTPSADPPALSIISLGGKPHFRLLGVPVRVSPGFWLMAMVMAGTRQDLREIFVWTLVVFSSVLVHELGHALVARAFGATPAVLLYTLGGVTVYAGKLSRSKSGLISLAGPLAGFAFGAAVLLLERYAVPMHQPLVAMVVRSALWVNIGWGLVNLMPVLPFDGGHILAAVLGPKRSLATSLVSAVAGIAVCVYAWVLRSYFLGILFGTAAMNAMMQVRAAWASRADVRDGLEAQLAEAKSALQEGEPQRAYELAFDVTRRARTVPVRDAAWALVAWVHVAKGEGRRAREALAQVSPQAPVDPYTLAAVEDAAGNRTGAVQVLEMARAQGLRTSDTSKLLIDLYARAGDWERAAELAVEDAALIGQDDARKVIGALFEGREYAGAAGLADRLVALYGQVDDAVTRARALARAGAREQALQALEAVVSMTAGEGDAGAARRIALAADPAFESLASDERFRAIVERTPV